MKKAIITYLLLQCAYNLCAQDVVKLKDFAAFNCKIISQNKSDIQFIKRGDTTLSIKKAPMHLVEWYKYNAVVDEQLPTKSIADTVVASPLIFAKPLAQNYSNSEHLSVAKTTLTLSAVLGVGAGVCGLVVMLNKEPEPPTVPAVITPASLDDFNNKMQKFKEEAERYSNTYKIGTGLGIVFGSAAILTAIAGSYAMIRDIERPATQRLSIVPMNNGIYMCYRF
jgi:hypothetical protein